VGIGHSLLALQSTLRGLGRLEVDQAALQADLEDAWEILAEPIQTVMKRVGYADAYERLKQLTRGARITREALQGFVRNLGLPEEDEQRLLALTPAAYIGIGPELVDYQQEG
jgi:adenylosuccinate lyase